MSVTIEIVLKRSSQKKNVRKYSFHLAIEASIISIKNEIILIVVIE